MSSPWPALKHGELTDQIIGIFYDVYNELGHGFLESVYQNVLSVALAAAGLKVVREYPIAVWFRGTKVGEFRCDLAVNDTVLLELKTAQAIDRVHEAQLLNCLRATEFELGLLLNLGPKPQFRRLLLTNDQKKIRVNPCKSVVPET